MTRLPWEDLQTLSILASEKADDQRLSMQTRERWGDIAARVIDGSGSAKDLHAVAELAELDATLQRDEKVRQRYLSLAKRAIAAAR